jgi:hypothetical protein
MKPGILCRTAIALLVVGGITGVCLFWQARFPIERADPIREEESFNHESDNDSSWASHPILSSRRVTSPDPSKKNVVERKERISSSQTATVRAHPLDKSRARPEKVEAFLRILKRAGEKKEKALAAAEMSGIAPEILENLLEEHQRRRLEREKEHGAKALALIYQVKNAQTLEEARGIFQQLRLCRIDKVTSEALMDFIRDTSSWIPGMRQLAFDLLRIGSSEGVQEFYVHILQYEQDAQLVAEAISDVIAREREDLLIDTYRRNGSSRRIRHEIIRKLVELGDNQKAKTFIVNAAQYGCSDEERALVTGCLIPSVSAYKDILVAALQDVGESRDIRQSAVRQILIGLEDEEIKAVLINTMRNDPAKEVRMCIVESLHQMANAGGVVLHDPEIWQALEETARYDLSKPVQQEAEDVLNLLRASARRSGEKG